ncbi:hypothetical protein TIFTF001_056310, partial [Ficus carica]
MAPSFSDLLQGLCRCQDETDDGYFIVFSNTLRNIRKLFKKDCDQTFVRTDINTSPSNSESYDNNFPTSVPPNLEFSQSLYLRKSPSSKPPQFTSILPCTLSSTKTPPPPSSSSSPVYSFAASSSKPPQSSYVSPSSNLSNPPQFTSILPCTSSSPKTPPPPSSSSSSPVYSIVASSSKPPQSSYVSPSPNISNPSPSSYKIPQQHSTKPSLISTYGTPSSLGPKLSFSPSSSSSPQKIPLLTLKPAP